MEESDVGHEEDEEELDPEHANDPQLPLARDALMNKYFAPGTKRIYYQRQLQVVLEREYFHWITAAAVKTLTGDNSIATEITQVGDSVVRLLWPHGHRYRSREQKVLLGLVERISTPDFATGVGRHAETLFDAALPRIGMKPVARDVKDFDGKTWVKTNHNLDRIFELDGINYGIEIKNQLQYIGLHEFRTKLDICDALGLTPLFIMRTLPKAYSWEVIKRGGFALVFGYQLYPHGSEALAQEVKRVLGLPAECPRAIFDNTLQRFKNWHDKKLAAAATPGS